MPIALALVVLLAAQVDAAEPVFYASFDRSIEPEKSAGPAGATTSDTEPARFAPGVVGQAVVVSPRSWISYSAAQNIKPDRGSISFLTRPVGWNGDDSTFHFFLKARSPANDWLIIYKVPENKLHFTGGNAASYSFAEAPAEDWKDGQWKHVCVTWAGQDAVMYVDGAQVAKARWPVLARDFGDEFMLGGAMFGESTAEQAIDELTIYSETLSADEVSAIFAKYKEPMEKANAAPRPEESSDSGEAPVLLSASFNGSIDAQQSQGGSTAKPTGEIAFARGIRGTDKAVLLGRHSALAFPLKDNLNPVAGTVSFWVKPIGWSGGDGQWHYILRLAGDDDWIMLQTVSNNLAFLGGTRQQYSETAVSVADWSDAVWRHVTVTWDAGVNRIYFDGKPATEARSWPRVPINLGNEIILGGQLHGDSTGQIALQDFEIRDAALSPPQVEALYLASVDTIPALVAQRDFVKQQQTLDPHNVATPAHGAILLPSSQAHSLDVQVEKACDGNFDTHYLSATGTYPNWVEIRWPQPVKINKVLVNESLDHKTAQYRIDAHVDGGWTSVVPEKTNARRPGEQIVETFDPVETTRIRYVMLAPDARGDDAKLACSLIQEIQACSVEAMPDFSTIAKPAWKSHWIWFPEGPVSDVARYFRAHFQVDDAAKVSRAVLQIGCDDAYELYINEQHVGSGGIPTDKYEVQQLLKSGDNVIAIKASQFSGFAGLICELALVRDDGTVRIASDQSWKTTQKPGDDWKLASADESNWRNSAQHGIPPNCPDHQDQAYYDEIGKDRFILGDVTITPTDARPGQSVELSVQASIPQPTAHDYAFEARIGEKKVSLFADFTVASKTFFPATPTSQWKPGEKQTLATKIYLPDWSPHGEVPLFLTPVGPDAQRVFDGANADGVIARVNIRKFDVDPKPWPAELPTAQVQPSETGHAKLLVNGKVLPPQILTENSYASYEAFGQQAKTGIHFWRIYAARGRDSKFYPADKQRERAELCKVFDAHVEALLKVDPEAHILIGTTFNVSQEWTDKYPDDATVLSNGNRVQHSFSSQRWMDETRADIDAIVKHLMNSPYAGHIVGFHFGIGAGPETYYWGLNANAYGTPRERLVLGDYSPQHVAAFRQWLRERYADDAALQTAWNDPKVTLDTAGIDLEALRREDLMMFRDPAVSRSAIDYWEFHSDVMARRVIDIAGAIKQSSGGKLLTGFWGLYSNGMNALSNNPGKMQHSAYAGLQKAMECDDVDYIAMLQEYLNVRWGTPMVPDNLTESIRRHGKLSLIEYDMRTFFTPVQFTERTFSQGETLSVMRRDIAAAAVRGDAFWWVGFPQGTAGRLSVPWFAEESILETLAEGRRVYQACYSQDARSASEVAVFINNADMPMLDAMTGHHLLASTQYNTWANELTKMGAPFDQYHFDDVTLPAMDQYKVYIFLNAFNLDDAARQKVETLLEKPGKTVVWLYAPGFSDGKTLSVENIERLTGFKVAMEKRKALPEVLIYSSHAFTKMVPDQHGIRPKPYEHHAGPFEIGPIFNVVDPDAQALGSYADNGKVACAYKKTANGHAIYLAIPYLDAALARSICRAAGVHLYADNDVYLDASQRLLCITSTSQAYRSVIKLPRRSAVYDVFNRRIVGSDTQAFRADVPPLSTALYFIGPETEMKQFEADINSN